MNDKESIREKILHKAIRTCRIYPDDGWRVGLEKVLPVFDICFKYGRGSAAGRFVHYWTAWFGSEDECTPERFRSQHEELTGVAHWRRAQISKDSDEAK